MQNFRRHLAGRVCVLATFIATFGLLSMAGSADASSMPTLKLGSRGAAVKTLQRDLTTVGIKTTADGYYYYATRASVIRYKRREHLTANGIVGLHMWADLQAAVKRINAKATAARAASGGSGLYSTPPTTTTDTIAPHLTLNSDGLVNIPADIPAQMTAMLKAANAIAKLPYVWGGGHASFRLVSGYDCSGSVSYILHAAGLMNAVNGDPSVSTYDSEEFAGYGDSGASTTGWATLWVAAATHVYMHIGNLWFDTAGLYTSTHSRWTTSRISPASGFVARHPVGW